MMLKILFFLLLGLNKYGHTYTNDKIILSGKLHSFNEKEVQILSQNKIYTLPRKLILLSTLISDQPIHVEVSLTEFQSFKQVKK